MCDAAGAVRYLTLPISGELAGSEVYTLLRRHLGLSGTVLRRVKWLSDGITVDGARVNVRFRVAAGQVLLEIDTKQVDTSKNSMDAAKAMWVGNRAITVASDTRKCTQ